MPRELYLCTETPETFDILVNGQKINKTDCGFFRDESFRLIDILDYAICGENTVELYSTVSQSERCYNHLSQSWEFESMKNSLSYDMEIEQIYIVGSFGAKIGTEITELGRDAYKIKACPIIVSHPKTVDIARLDMSGFPEFSGTLTLEKTFKLEDTERSVRLVGRGINSVHISVNGRDVATKMFPPYEVDLTDYLKKGENVIGLTLVNNLRNMQGPFHLKEGECYAVIPASFYRESNVFAVANSRVGESCHDVLEKFDDDICLVHYGMK